ncbi:hypothetical protein MHY87_00320 [Microvirga sp. ACRRW]|uniref:hypothetical protein n=1 Tax=Microvirga sp. ACRRW TaxID=2918205 RepID=UPI001EF5A191|nr:hypothetical protein [Microvirga sp. ACRRW]MCG7391351.1 hypothetical protein [Microvirga sp. ACRRW]
MISLRASEKKINSPYGGWTLFVASFALAAGLIFAPLPADAAHLPQELSAAKAVKSTGTAVASKDVEETGSIKVQDADTGTCSKSRKRLFVEGEGWIVRKLTTCY